jgi:hypothetical protein
LGWVFSAFDLIWQFMGRAGVVGGGLPVDDVGVCAV